MKKISTPVSILLIVWAVLAIVFAFTDWQISQTLYNPEAGWSHFLEAYGQLPGSFLGILSGSILLRTYKTQKNTKSILGVIGLTLLTVLATFSFSADAFGAQADTSQINILPIIGLSLAILIISQLILHRFSFEAVSQYKTAARVGLSLLIIAGFATVWLFKIPWGRWTYRDILAAGNNALFTPWYLPQGINGHHSFFSGHTSLSFTVIGYINFVKKNTVTRKILLGILLLWGIVGGLSRIVIGAHFASDVLFGAGQTLLWFLLLSKWHKVNI